MRWKGGTFRERLGRWIKGEKNKGGNKAPRRIYDIVEGPYELVVEEKEEKGKAVVRCQLPPGNTCAVFRLHGEDGLFGFLLKSYNADGAFLVALPDGGVLAWVVECKATLTSSTWEHTLKQFRWTVARLLAIAGVIGVEITSVSLMTAFREDQLSQENSPNPALGKLPIGESAEGVPGDDDMTWEPVKLHAWHGDDVPLEGFLGTFRHRKLRLDAQGNGRCTFKV